MGKVKLKDIANASGVSISSVSRILSGDKTRKMKDETKEAVIGTAQRLGYYSDKKESLKLGIGVIRLGVLFVSDHDSMSSQFFSAIIDGIKGEVKALSKYMNISLVILEHGTAEFEKALDEKELDAGIILGRTSKDVIRRIKESVPRLIYSGLNSFGGMDEVLCDSREGIKDGVDYLYSLGKRHIAYIGPVSTKYETLNEHRYIGYIEALADKNIEIDPEFVEGVYLDRKSGYDGAKKLLLRVRPDAIVAANDDVALGVLSYLRDKGISVPSEIAVIGFDNIEQSQEALTTLDVPKKELGRLSVKFLLDRIENPREMDISIRVPYKLIKRESTEGGGR